MKVRAVIVRTPGTPEVMSVETIELPLPGPREVRVWHSFIGVNYLDTYHRSGLYPMEMPLGLGVEAAGVVESVGQEVTRVKVGDRVVYGANAGQGAYAEAKLVSEDRVIRLPDDVPDDVAAASFLKGLTVEYLIRRTYPVKAGETVLFHAAAGGVGLIACQWLSHLGARVIGTVSSEAKGELALAHGAAHVVDYTKENFVERVREITLGHGVPVAYDSVGATTFERTLACLAPRGLAVSFGNASGRPPPLDLGLLQKGGSLFVTRPTMHDYTRSIAEQDASAAALFEMIGKGVVKVVSKHRFPLGDVVEAHRALESRATSGSLLLVP